MRDSLSSSHSAIREPDPSAGKFRKEPRRLKVAKCRAHLYIEGLVQGVFYRAFVRELALRTGLRGWVRNLPDGRVEAVFEGAEEDIESAVRECRKGPPAARVTNVDVTWEPYKGEFRDFEIRYF